MKLKTMAYLLLNSREEHKRIAEMSDTLNTTTLQIRNMTSDMDRVKLETAQKYADTALRLIEDGKYLPYVYMMMPGGKNYITRWMKIYKTDEGYQYDSMETDDINTMIVDGRLKKRPAINDRLLFTSEPFESFYEMIAYLESRYQSKLLEELFRDNGRIFIHSSFKTKGKKR